MKDPDRNEDMPSSEVICERGSKEQSEYGPQTFQPENSPSAQREQPDDASVMKQENMESDKLDQVDDNSYQSKGIYDLILQQFNILIMPIIFYMKYIERHIINCHEGTGGIRDLAVLVLYPWHFYPWNDPVPIV
jgi:hypothetical protein